VKHQAVIYDQQGGGIDWTFRRGAGETSTIRIDGRVRVTAAEAVRQAVFSGLGFVIASEWLFQPELRSGVVTSVLDDWALPAIDLWAVFPSGRQASAKARAFVDFLEKQVKNTATLQELIPAPALQRARRGPRIVRQR
jgi:DNA-binding transcriptional LysR family regulator